MRFHSLLLAAAVCGAPACYEPYDSSGHGFELGGSLGPDCGSVQPCSITETSCQRAVLEVTACVRDEAVPELPSIRVITRDELRAERAAEPLAAPTRSEIATHDALVALKLLAAEGTLAEAQRAYTSDATAAFYRLDEKDVTVISDMNKDPQDAMSDLAHELSHYLQDRAGQLDGLKGPFASTDAHLARTALVEGDAVVSSLHATAAMLGRYLSPADWLILPQRVASKVDDETNHTDSPFLSALNMLPYSMSLQALTAAWIVGGHAQVEDFFDHPPQAMHDWLLSGQESVSAPPAALSCNPPLAPEGYELVSADTIGNAGLYALLGTQQLASLGATAGWQHDVLAIYAQKTNAAQFDTAVVWRIRFDNEQSANQLADSISPLGLTVARNQEELTITTSSNPPLFTEEQLAACPTYEALKASVVSEAE